MVMWFSFTSDWSSGGHPAEFWFPFSDKKANPYSRKIRESFSAHSLWHRNVIPCDRKATGRQEKRQFPEHIWGKEWGVSISVSMSLSPWLNPEPPSCQLKWFKPQFYFSIICSPKYSYIRQEVHYITRTAVFSKFPRLYFIVGIYLKAHSGSNLKEHRAQSQRGPSYGEEKTGMKWGKEMLMGLGTSLAPAWICSALMKQTWMDITLKSWKGLLHMEVPPVKYSSGHISVGISIGLFYPEWFWMRTRKDFWEVCSQLANKRKKLWASGGNGGGGR